MICRAQEGDTMNTIEFFRFNKYEDVFIEGDHLLYACADNFGRPYMFAVCEYTGFLSEFVRFDNEFPEDVEDVAEWVISDYSGADIQYLENLTPAHPFIAAAVINSETRRTVTYTIEDNDERAAYLEYKTAEVNDRAQELLND